MTGQCTLGLITGHCPLCFGVLLPVTVPFVYCVKSIPVIALRIEDDILNTINQSSKMVDSEYSIPSQRKHSIIVSIPKKGSSLSLNNQRGIAKWCAISKLRNKILLIESSR